MQLLVNRLKFAATVTAPRCARMFVNHTLMSWLLADLVDDAELIVSELVTNAVNATGITDPDPTYADLAGLALLAVQVRVTRRSLFIEVWDNDSDGAATSPPSGKEPDEGGRGLVIVGALSERHGVTRLLDGGKVVGAALDAGSDIAAVPQIEPQPLPRGFRRVVLSEARQPGQHAQADLALMDRITRRPT
jgi:anti-sigma regulatory factor (Ser/Thr protein kinase)